ncbi:GNAT family N-acetyltransferase [Vreelandella neptunia]|uniref:GNAT family N-acetyltransferase n=1 Tax=Vreelandella neptunia TaxID=115551 RepID=A0ABS9S4Y0_9GAMM|nr:GNAT family N-acetyltransferase [Halomonas neptunia]MCH4811177.1 GNAT family N-acetyltransferase [Halomonas neptunia]
MKIEFLPLENRHLDQAVKLSSAVGWPHRYCDWQRLLALGTGIAGVNNDSLIATGMHWSFDTRLATLGLVIVSPAYKRQGLGRRMMEALLNGISAPRIELHATQAGADLYRSLGFTETAWVHQCQGRVADSGSGHAPYPLPPHTLLRSYQATDYEALIALDEQAIGSPRKALLFSLLAHGEALVLEQADGQLIGTAFCREFGRGYVIGPVIAKEHDAARCLIEGWLNRRAGSFVRLDTLDSDLAAWLNASGVTEVDRIPQMTWGSALHRVGPAKRYALANQALG